MVAGAHDTTMAVTGLTVTVNVPFLVVSWLEMAVTVTVVDAFTAWAVKSPLASIDPALVPQVTVEMKLPVPVTVAVHWLVWPDWIAVGVQVTVTAVMVEVLELPPPQAAMMRRAAMARRRARKRKLVPQETIRMRREGRK